MFRKLLAALLSAGIAMGGSVPAFASPAPPAKVAGKKGKKAAGDKKGKKKAAKKAAKNTKGKKKGGKKK
jgi:hypothetical protein